MTVQMTRGYTYAANSTVGASNLGALVMSATATLIDRASIEQTNYTLATVDGAPPPGTYEGELWHDTTHTHPLLKSYRSSGWALSLPYAVPVRNDSSSSTWSQGTLVACGLEDGTYRIAWADSEPFGITDHGESNVVAVSLETVAVGATGYVAFHGVLPVLSDGSSSTAGWAMMLSDTVAGAAEAILPGGEFNRLFGYSVAEAGSGGLPDNLFWCRFFR